jgi:hypothetical protein
MRLCSTRPDAAPAMLHSAPMRRRGRRHLPRDCRRHDTAIRDRRPAGARRDHGKPEKRRRNANRHDDPYSGRLCSSVVESQRL